MCASVLFKAGSFEGLTSIDKLFFYPGFKKISYKMAERESESKCFGTPYHSLTVVILYLVKLGSSNPSCKL